MAKEKSIHLLDEIEEGTAAGEIPERTNNLDENVELSGFRMESRINYS